MPIEPLVIVLIMVLGIMAFFFGIVMLFCRLLMGIRRSILRLILPHRRSDRSGGRALAPRAIQSGALICPGLDCRKIETRLARFCSRCGRQLKKS